MVLQPTFGGGERRRVLVEESMEARERRLAEESKGAEEIHDYLDKMEKGGTSSEFKPMQERNPAWADSKEGAQEMHDDLDKTETEGTTSVRKTRRRLKSPVVDPLFCKISSKIFEDDFRMMDMRFHRFPEGMKNLGERYIVPMVVSIGPYHRKLGQFDATEEVKLVTAYQFVSGSSGSFEEICAAILPLAPLSRSLYDSMLPGYTDDDLVRMLLLDGCFLLQYMLMYTARDKLSSSLLCYFDSNQVCISNDIMLLENQIPWVVIETLRRFKEVPVEEFVAKMGRTLQVRKEKEREEFDLGDGYKPPHLLGLLRFYKTRHTLQVPRKNEQKLPALGSSSASEVPTSGQDGQISMSKNISAIELAEMGIKLMASKTTKLMDMGMEKRPLSGNIFLAPLLLDDIRSCWLVNMAALEVCLATGVRDDEEPVVCSYLALLAMLMDREEDVHKLRSKRLVQGELTNKETLDFFKTLIRHISGGSLYIRILEEIEDYKLKRRIWIKIYEYVYRNKKAIVTVLSLVGVLAGIFKALLSVKHGQQ